MSLILSKNYPTLQLSSIVFQRCQDFLKTNGFNYFQYLRCYKNGSVSLLINDTSLLKYFLELDFPIFSFYREDHHRKSSYWFFWDEELPWLPVKIAREKSNFNHGVTFVRRSPLYYDMIAFALPIQILNPASFYMSKMKLLEWFIHWFEWKRFIARGHWRSSPSSWRKTRYELSKLVHWKKVPIFYSGYFWRDIYYGPRTLLCQIKGARI